MRFCVNEPFKLVTGWDEERPIRIRKRLKCEDIDANTRAELEKALRPHAAWDIAGERMAILAPETGYAYYHWIDRPKPGDDFVTDIYWPSGQWYGFSRYYSDVWGGLIILEGDSGITHVYAHVEEKQIMSRGKMVIRQEKIQAIKQVAKEGMLIGFSGNAGLSYGPHIHMELHASKKWMPHETRRDPAELWPEVWSAHKHEIYETEVNCD
tara:strand:- start:433 stop:1062 length:630 start_codon:yes stop_codon:yes gene_type:complete